MRGGNPLLRRGRSAVLGGPWRGWCRGGGWWSRDLFCCFFCVSNTIFSLCYLVGFGLGEGLKGKTERGERADKRFRV